MKGALVITGPTASGKSRLAVDVALSVGGEIISADSAQVYRGMDIGTAKPDPALLGRVPHHLIDVRDPAEPYSAADFREDAIRLVREILSRGRLPVIAGGAMLYLKALKEGLADLPAADAVVRREISREAERYGWARLHEELQRVDPGSARRIGPGDSQRLQRALEVYRLTGLSLTDLHRQSREPCPFPLLEMALLPGDRRALHAAIAERFHTMLERGLIAEVAALKANPDIHPGLPAIKAVGYRQVWSYLAGEIGEDTMIEAGIAATRQLAKRQFTWLRGWKGLIPLAFPDANKVLKNLIDSIILS